MECILTGPRPSFVFARHITRPDGVNFTVGQSVRALARALLCLVVHCFFQCCAVAVRCQRGEISALKSVHFLPSRRWALRFVCCEKRSMIMEMMMLGARSRSEHEQYFPTRSLAHKQPTHRHVHNSLIQLSNDRSSVN